MSTLKTHNLQSPDAGSVNIALTANAGMIVTGISTFNDRINIGSLGVTTNFTVAGLSTFSEDTKFIGAISGRDLQWDKSDNALEFLDYTSAYFGTDNNLQIYHNAGNNNSYISENGVGSLLIQASDLYLNNSAGQNYVVCATGGRVQLNFAGNNKLETTNTGVNITGICTATSFSGDGSSLSNLPAGAPVGGASTNTVFFENDKLVEVGYQITSTKNAMSAGPVSISAGIAVTVPSGCSWTIV